MLVGLRTDPKIQQAKAARCERGIIFAISKIKESPIASYVEHLYLYGSCARGEQTATSDVDLFMQLVENSPVEKLHIEVLLLKSEFQSIEWEIPDVDLKVVVGNNWRSSAALYYENVRKDGIELWQEAKTMTI